MQLHGAPSPKPTTLWSTMREIASLDLGVLTRAEKEKRTTVSTVRKYVDPSGRARFVGTPALSASQKLGSNCFIYFCKREHSIIKFLKPDAGFCSPLP